MSDLRVEHVDDAVVLRLDAPARRNALDLGLLRDLVAALGEADAGDARAIVLTGTDPAFCAGLDLAAVASGEVVLERLEEQDADPWVALQRTRTPTIAAVNGAAVTGGLELVLGCDLVVASDRARFADTHARVGIHPSGGMSVLLPRAVGHRTAVGLSLTGRFVAADEALALGLAHAVVPHDRLRDEALQLARDLAETDPRVVTELLRTYRDVAGRPLDEALRLERERGFALGVDPATVEARRAAVVARGRRLAGS